jgi:hypothetical protein
LSHTQERKKEKRKCEIKRGDLDKKNEWEREREMERGRFNKKNLKWRGRGTFIGREGRLKIKEKKKRWSEGVKNQRRRRRMRENLKSKETRT